MVLGEPSSTNRMLQKYLYMSFCLCATEKSISNDEGFMFYKNIFFIGTQIVPVRSYENGDIFKHRNITFTWNTALDVIQCYLAVKHL